MRGLAILIAAMAIGSCAPAPLASTRQYNPTVVRDAYGVPSVHGRDDQEAAYGIGYAHAQDNFATIQIVVLAARGRLGAHLGEDGAKSDFLWHLLGIRQAVDAGFDTRISSEFRAVAQGYADGLNAYAAERVRCAGGALPVGEFFVYGQCAGR